MRYFFMLLWVCVQATVSGLALDSVLAAAEVDDIRNAYPWLLVHPDPSFRCEARHWRGQTENYTWSDSTGRFTVEAGYVRHSRETATLQRRDGTRISVPIEKLDEKSKEMLKGIEGLRPQIVAALKYTQEYRKLMVSRGGHPSLRPLHPVLRREREEREMLKSREDRLAALSEEKEAVLADYRRMISDRQRGLFRLEVKLDRIRKVRQTPRSVAVAKEWEKQRKKLESAVKEVVLRSKVTFLVYEQRQRPIQKSHKNIPLRSVKRTHQNTTRPRIGRNLLFIIGLQHKLLLQSANCRSQFLHMEPSRATQETARLREKTPATPLIQGLQGASKPEPPES